MENTNVIGIIRHIDDLGRIVIPKEIRKRIGIEEGDSLDILTTTDGSLLLRKVVNDKPLCDCPGVEKTESEKKVVHFVDNYNDITKVVKITPEQNKLLNWLINNYYLSSDVDVNEGYPNVEDLA